MITLKRYIFLIILILFFSCEDSKYFTNCDGCTSTEPVEVNLKAEIDKAAVDGVLVKVWEGKIEDSILIESKLVRGTDTYEKKVPLNRTYTLTATYIIDYKSYTVVDSKTPRVKYTADMCDNPCYYVYDNTLNLTRKYVK